MEEKHTEFDFDNPKEVPSHEKELISALCNLVDVLSKYGIPDLKGETEARDGTRYSFLVKKI